MQSAPPLSCTPDVDALRDRTFLAELIWAPALVCAVLMLREGVVHVLSAVILSSAACAAAAAADGDSLAAAAASVLMVIN